MDKPVPKIYIWENPKSTPHKIWGGVHRKDDEERHGWTGEQSKMGCDSQFFSMFISPAIWFYPLSYLMRFCKCHCEP